MYTYLYNGFTRRISRIDWKNQGRMLDSYQGSPNILFQVREIRQHFTPGL